MTKINLQEQIIELNGPSESGHQSSVRRFEGGSPDNAEPLRPRSNRSAAGHQVEEKPFYKSSEIEASKLSLAGGKENLLSPARTYFSLLKNFVNTGLIYLPKSFMNGGWGFQILALALCGAMTACCL